MKCRSCGNEKLMSVLSLGSSPLANNFLSQKQLSEEEPFFPLELLFCEKCKLVQLSYVVPAEVMFKNYVYVTSTTLTFRQHFTKMAEDISRRFLLGHDSLVVDIGSNDGLLLKGFQSSGARVMGVEPATNIARIAEQNGVETINDFFDESSVNEILRRKGNADVVTATNVFAHVDDIKELSGNVKRLLKPNGVFVIEIQYFMDTMEKMTFDNVYHEHLSYFTLTSIVNFFSGQDMEVFDVVRVDSHGGSLRVFIQKKGGHNSIEPSVKSLLDHELSAGVNDIMLYSGFAGKVNKVREKLLEYVKKIKADGKSIVGYGAPAKSATLLNFCGISASQIDYIVDDNPLKVGLFAPGTHIPVVSSSMLDEKTPDYVLVLAWNFANEILAKTRKYSEKGVKFIIPLPSPVVV